jgi:hypothetical protein
MRTGTRLAGFAAILAVVFGLGWGIGASVGSRDPQPTGGEPVATTVAGETDDATPYEEPGSHDAHEGQVIPPPATADGAGLP